MKFALVALISAVAAEEPKKEATVGDYTKKKIGETCDDTKADMGCVDNARCGWTSTVTDGGTPVLGAKVCVKSDDCGKDTTEGKVETKTICDARALAAAVSATLLAISYTI